VSPSEPDIAVNLYTNNGKYHIAGNLVGIKFGDFGQNAIFYFIFGTSTPKCDIMHRCDFTVVD